MLTSFSRQKEVIMSAKHSSGLAEVNGAQLYYEMRGSGPSALFIPGATGDAGHFEPIAEMLSDEFTVLTYDRRGNSRSPRPEDWGSTSPAEHSDDAAALIDALGVAPTTVFGTSSGAIISLDLVLRHPDVVRGAILHEPPMATVVSNPEETLSPLQEAVQRGMQEGGPPQAIEAFFRLVAGDEAFENLDVRLRERMLSNAETFFGTEFGVFEPYRPDDATFQTVKVPVQVMAGSDSAPLFVEASRWCADQLNVELNTLPGAHTPYFDRPEETADTLRPLLRQLSGYR
jgi:pimeloyl-ACP methyl ester carboxylesterase